MKKQEAECRTYVYALACTEIRIQITKVGDDYNIVVSGGDRPHVGCTVLAVPRPSLTGDGHISVTSSVLNVTGHKDEAICRCLAEQVAQKQNAVTVCTGGVHMDQASPELIREILDAVKRAAEDISMFSPAYLQTPLPPVRESRV